MSDSPNARQWLKENEYEEVEELIDQIMVDWKRRHVETRRNWWEVLAGTKKGRPRVVNGHEFPILQAAQRRQGLPVTKNAITKHRRESCPEIQYQIRWTND